MELRLAFPSGRGKKASHTYMDGGVLTVPPDKFSSFCRIYTQCVSNKMQKICLVERCDPGGFNYFLDIDYKATSFLDIAEIETLTTDIARRLNIGRCLVMVAEPRTVDGGMWKSGIHVVWPGHVVQRAKALEYRQDLLDCLQGRGGLDWEGILDPAVYRGGLRMPWSWKFQKRKYETPYLPLHIIDDQGGIRPVSQEPDEIILRMSSIRTSSIKRDEWTMEQAVGSDTMKTHLQGFIQNCLPGQMRAKVKDVWKQGDTGFCVVTTNSKYCENKGTSHRSNHVYFVIDSLGKIYQKCQSMCNHRKGSCSTFRGKFFNIPTPIYRELFPEVL